MSHSSKQSFAEYLERVRQRKREKQPPQPYHGSTSAEPKKTERNRSFSALFWQFIQLMEGHRNKVTVGIVLMIFATLLALLPPLGTKLAIDSVLTKPPHPLPGPLAQMLQGWSPMAILVWIAVAVACVTLLRTAIHLVGRWLSTQAVNQLTATIRRKVFEHSLELPLHSIYKIKSGGITSLLREDAGGVSDLVFSMLFNPLQAMVQLVGSLLVLVLVDWRLLLSAILILPAVYFSHRTWIRSIRPLYRDVRSQRQTVDASATETFSGIRVVRTFARQKSETIRFVEGNHLLVRQQLMVWIRTRLIEIVWEVLIPLASTLLLIYGGYQILQGELTLGDLMMFLVYLTMLLGPIATLAGSAVTFQNNLAGLDRVLDILELHPEMKDSPNAVALHKSSIRGDMEVRNVSFRYPEGSDDVLNDLSFDVQAGQTIALVGRSGAGKTTLCNLIARFYDPTSGSILIDGMNLKDTQLQSYRRLLGVVEQDVFLFDGSIAENIAYGRKDATRQEIMNAAQAAAAHEFISSTTNGYDTIIGERGVKLSGGQRQRIAIARAILADPKILILDEATSNLDSESEQLIQKSLAYLLSGRTAFVIAHRLSTIVHADLILVMENGRIIERGTHEELVSIENGKYRKMIALQTEQAIAIVD